MSVVYNCTNCQFWNAAWRDSGALFLAGQCRRHAPVAIAETPIDSRWPQTYGREWCGDHKQYDEHNPLGKLS